MVLGVLIGFLHFPRAIHKCKHAQAATNDHVFSRHKVAPLVC